MPSTRTQRAATSILRASSSGTRGPWHSSDPRRDRVIGDAESSIRAALGRLLDTAGGSQTPALSAASKRRSGAGLHALAAELEGALIPVNRAAARRAGLLDWPVRSSASPRAPPETWRLRHPQPTFGSHSRSWRSPAVARARPSGAFLGGRFDDPSLEDPERAAEGRRDLAVGRGAGRSDSDANVPPPLPSEADVDATDRSISCVRGLRPSNTPHELKAIAELEPTPRLRPPQRALRVRMLRLWRERTHLPRGVGHRCPPLAITQRRDRGRHASAAVSREARHPATRARVLPRCAPGPRGASSKPPSASWPPQPSHLQKDAGYVAKCLGCAVLAAARDGSSSWR